MFITLTEKLFEKYIDFAWEMALKPENAIFPIYFDKLSSKASFIAEAKRDRGENAESFLVSSEEQIIGWIQFYWIPKDKLIRVLQFSVTQRLDDVMDEFIAYLSIEKFKGYDLQFVIGLDNINLIAQVQRYGFEKNDEIFYHLFDVSAYTPSNEIGLIRITTDNYALFKAIHDKTNGPTMYWNSERLLERLDQWEILITEDLQGAICFNQHSGNAEIFCVDMLEFEVNERYEKLLKGSLNRMKELNIAYCIYFCEPVEFEVLRKHNFEYVGGSSFYRKVIE